MKRAILPLCLVAVLAVGAFTLSQRQGARMRDLKAQFQAEIDRLEAENQQRRQQDAAEHDKSMSDSELISGSRAATAHEAEWNRRLAYDPELATTLREKTILEIEAISKDRSMAAQKILEKVAKLASPRNSEIEVETMAQGFRVDVKFDMSVMTSGEQGSRTKHNSIDSLKRETVEIIARVLKDLYDHCGQKGIDNIAVACTHGVQVSSSPAGIAGTFRPPTSAYPGVPSVTRGLPKSSFPGISGGTSGVPTSPFAGVSSKPTVTKTIYKCCIPVSGARRIMDWRRAPLHRVEDMLKVEHNEFPRLRIVTTTVPGFGW